MATDSAFWSDLEARFRALPDSTQLRAMESDGQWSVYGGPTSDPLQRERLQELFRSLARTAGIAAGVPNPANALDGWLNLLCEESPDFNPVHGTITENGVTTRTEGGWIQNLALASAEYCIVRATRAFELETAAAVAPAGLPLKSATKPQSNVRPKREPHSNPEELLAGKDRVPYAKAGDALGLSERRIRQLVEEGKLTKVGTGQRLMITTASIRAMIESRQ